MHELAGVDACVLHTTDLLVLRLYRPSPPSHQPLLEPQREEAGGELSFLIEPKLDGERQQVRAAALLPCLQAWLA